MVNKPDWASPVAPQTSPAKPTISPMMLDRRSVFTFPVSCWPTTGNWPATALSTCSRKLALTEAASPSTVVRMSSSGKSETNAEYARLEASTPPLSSPYFLLTPNTKAAGMPLRAASTRRITRSTGFITPPAPRRAWTAPDRPRQTGWQPPRPCR